MGTSRSDLSQKEEGYSFCNRHGVPLHCVLFPACCPVLILCMGLQCSDGRTKGVSPGLIGASSLQKKTTLSKNVMASPSQLLEKAGGK